ncbi:hypothetical protein N9176_00835 [bacterium]|nr:hypothetical protein [bacterium]
MNYLKVVCFLLLAGSSHAQILSLNLNDGARPYSNCAAVLYNGEMLVSEYSIYGECKLEQGQKGILSESTIKLTAYDRKPIMPIEFKVAVKNEGTNTIRMFDNKIYTQIPLEKVLEGLIPGDNIILMTTEKEYVLMHNEIKITWGC